MASSGTDNCQPNNIFYGIKKTICGDKSHNVDYIKMPDDNLIGSLRKRYTPLHGQVFLRLAGLLGALATGLAAYGTHVVLPNSQLSDDQKRIFLTGNLIHYLHTMVILALPVTRRPYITGSLIFLGMALFCCPCYITGLTGITKVAVFAPYGGITLMLGWLSLIL